MPLVFRHNEERELARPSADAALLGAAKVSVNQRRS